MESPKSERSQTRYSTPVSDLDDHRHQPSTRALGDTVISPQSPGSPVDVRTALHNPVSPANPAQPELLQINEGLREAGSISRDFERAVIDDDRSENVEIGDHSPIPPRRGTVRRSQNPPNRSRESSPSSRASSPANSVDAFADPRRRERANTIGSKAPSELDPGLQRTVSGGTHRRRPTFNNGSVRGLSLHDDRASYHPPAEDDVCFPTADETTKTYKIDFEELDEFVAESSKSKSVLEHQCRQKLSFSSHGNRPRVFDDLRSQIIPKILTQSASVQKPDSECAIDDSDTVLDEKHGDILGVNVQKDRRQSLTEPSRYSFFSSELEQTIHAADLGDLLTPGETFRDLFELPQDSGVWWLDVLNPTEEELLVFQRAFGIHRLTTEDIITQEAREKVELFKQYYFVCFRSFFQMDHNSEDYMEPVNVYIVVFREGILTFAYTQSPHASNVRKRIGKLRDYMALTADWICYAMMYAHPHPH